MNHFFSRLLNKPYRYRRNVALGVAISVTLVIFSVWIVVTKERFDARFRSLAQAEASTTSSVPVEAAGPFEAISKTFSDGFDTIQKQFEELTKITK